MIDKDFSELEARSLALAQDNVVPTAEELAFKMFNLTPGQKASPVQLEIAKAHRFVLLYHVDKDVIKRLFQNEKVTE